MKVPCITFTEPLETKIGEIELGTPSRGQIRTRTRITGVSTGTETRVFRGNQDGSVFPLIPGYENLGEVVENGPGTTLEVGQRIYVRNHSYDPSPYTKLWGSQVGGALTDEASVVAIPETVSDERAICAKVAGIALHGVKRARVRAGENVVVVGLGIIGHLVVQHAVARGARVIAIDIDDKRLELAHEGGAEHTINANSQNVQKEVHTLTGGGADVAFDATGLVESLEQTSTFLRQRPWDDDPSNCARLILQGTVEDRVTIDYFALFRPEIDLVTPRDCDTQDLVDSLALMANGRLRPEIIYTTKFSYREADQAYTRLVSRELMRVLFTWE